MVSQLAFYGSYHSNRWNKLVHFLCVPLLMWSAMVWCMYLSEMPSDVVSLNPALFVVVIYGMYYLTFDVLVGLSWIVCTGLPLWVSATYLRLYVDRAWLWAVGVHVWSWYLQLHLGHGIFEKRRPAFVDSFFQSFMLAPLFVWYELLFSLGMCLELKARVEQEIKQSRF